MEKSDSHWKRIIFVLKTYASSSLSSRSSSSSSSPSPSPTSSAIEKLMDDSRSSTRAGNQRIRKGRAKLSFQIERVSHLFHFRSLQRDRQSPFLIFAIIRKGKGNTENYLRYPEIIVPNCCCGGQSLTSSRSYISSVFFFFLFSFPFSSKNTKSC